MVKRGKLEIIRDILAIIKENRNSIKPTPLLRKSGLSSSSFKEYYMEILERKLLEENINENGNRISLTEQGFRFLERYKSIIEFIDEFDL
jgi:predicted transcriptional regulator